MRASNRKNPSYQSLKQGLRKSDPPRKKESKPMPGSDLIIPGGQPSPHGPPLVTGTICMARNLVMPGPPKPEGGFVGYRYEAPADHDFIVMHIDTVHRELTPSTYNPADILTQRTGCIAPTAYMPISELFMESECQVCANCGSPPAAHNQHGHCPPEARIQFVQRACRILCAALDTLGARVVGRPQTAPGSAESSDGPSLKVPDPEQTNP